MANSYRYRQNQRGTWGLIVTLIAVAIMALLFVFIVYPKMDSLNPFKAKDGKSMPQAAMDEAKGVECASNLRQIRQALMIYRSEHESYPPTLMDLKLGVGPNFFKCPVAKTDYIYEPKTGQVRCPYPKHQGF